VKPGSIYREFIMNRWLYIMFLPPLIWFVIFVYWPMYGILIAFKNYNIVTGFANSPWVGIRYFEQFFSDPYFWRLLRNTLLINVYGLLWGFPVPILLALAFNELRNRKVKKVTQTISYLPYFISTVVVCGIVVKFLSPSTGVINAILQRLGFDSIYFLQKPEYFRTILISMGIWQSAGFNTIIYMATISGINTELYESAIVDGANRRQQAWYITLPGMLPTIVIMLILNLGQLLMVGHERIILLYNPMIYSTADVFNTYVYRRGLLEAEYSYAAAVSLFQCCLGFLLVYVSNRICRRLNETSLW